MRNARTAAVLTWIYAAAYGIPAIPVAIYLLQRGWLPKLQGLFDMYGGPWWALFYDDTFVALLAVFFVVTVVAAWAAWLLWKGARAGAVLSLLLLPVEALFWFGFALPIPWLFGIARAALVAVAWTSLDSEDTGSVDGAARRPTNLAITCFGLASGIVGVLANVYLVLFFLVDTPWQPSGVSSGYGTVNDWLIPIQLTLLLPVVLWLGQQIGAERRARTWTGVALVASAAAVVLQLLLVTDVLPFEMQVVLAAVSIVLLLCWAGIISGSAKRVGLLSTTTVRLGRLVMWAVPVGIAASAVGAGLSAIQGEGSWAWIVGGVPGAMAWLTFPIWTLLVAIDAGRLTRVDHGAMAGHLRQQATTSP